MEMTSNQIINIVGYQDLNFTAQDGKQIVGTKIWYTYDSENPYVKGQQCDNAYINKELPFIAIGKQYRGVFKQFFKNGQSFLRMVDLEEV